MRTPLSFLAFGALTAFSAVPGAAQRRTLSARLTGAQPDAAATVRADSFAIARLLLAVQSAASVANPMVLAAAAELNAARVRAAATGFDAPASVTAGISEAPNGDPSQGNLRLEVGREFFTATRRRAERGVADAAVQRAQTVLWAAGQQVVAAILRETVRASAWQSVAVRLTAEDVLLGGADESVRARFAVGAAQYVDVLRLRTERLRVQTERAGALAEVRSGRAALDGLLGDRAAATAATLDSLMQVGTNDSSGSVVDIWRTVLASPPTLDSLLDRAGDVGLADAGARQARAEQTLGLAQRQRQVSGYAGVQRIGQANNGPTFGPSVGITVSLPFTAARATRLSSQADAQGVAAAETSRRTNRAAVRTRLSIARTRYDAALERLTVFDAALLRGAREERESALAAYRAGGLSLLDFVDFERALARAEIDRVRALIDAADAYADLLTGGGDETVGLPLTLLAPDRR